MSNMSYCRFENTYLDLQDCNDALAELQCLEQAKEELSASEYRYMERLVKLCADISRDWLEDYEHDA